MPLAPAAIGLAAIVFIASGAWAQVPAAARAASAPASAPASAAPVAPRAKPIVSVFKVEKVTFDAAGQEELERATAANVGDIVQYSVTHTNQSPRRLLRVDFGIPIPHGTTYVADSAQPPGPKRVRLNADRDQMLWRVEVLEPGDSVTLRLRVRIDPDPTLVPTPAEPRRPELRRVPG